MIALYEKILNGSVGVAVAWGAAIGRRREEAE